MAEPELPARLRQSDSLRTAFKKGGLKRANLKKRRLKRGGLRGTTAWLIKQVYPVEIFDLFVTGINDLRGGAAEPDGRLLRLRTAADCRSCGEAMLDQFGRHSGHGARSIVASGGRVYALVEDGEIMAQLTMDLTGPVAIETPIPLTIALPEKTSFLSHLYTYPAWRRHGLAQRLIRSAVHDLNQEGVTQVIAHVSSTNVASQNAFLATGWRRTGLVVTDRSSRILYSEQRLAAHGITLAARMERLNCFQQATRF